MAELHLSRAVIPLNRLSIMPMVNLCLTLVVVVANSQHIYALGSHFQHYSNESSYFKNEPCPNAEDIAPCICTYIEAEVAMDMDCSTIADEQQLYDVFHATIPFPKFRRLDLGTDYLNTLSDTVFGEVTFEKVETLLSGNGSLTYVGPNTFIKSASTLNTLYLHNNKLEDFHYETLSEYKRLKFFSTYRNPIQNFPIIQSETIHFIDLGSAAYTSIPNGGLDGLPNLKKLRIRFMHLNTMAPGLFTNLSKIRHIQMQDVGLSHLENLQFGVTTNDTISIDLHANQITTVETDAFKGVQSGRINLMDNQLTILPEATWGPLIKAGVHLLLQGNDLTCGCDVAWLVLEPAYHEFVQDADCHSGEMLVDLDPSFFENFC